MKVTFSIYGLPQPQGNKTVINGHMVEGRRGKSRQRFKDWRTLMVERASKAAEDQGQFPEGPLHLGLSFWLPRPKVAKQTVWAWKRPDIDKLERAVLDALTISGLIGDDSRVVSVRKVKKYENEYRSPGVDVELEVIE